MIFILSSSRPSDERLYSAGISSRLVRSPAAPKITSVHGGAGCLPGAGGEDVAVASGVDIGFFREELNALPIKDHVSGLTVQNRDQSASLCLPPYAICN